MEQWKGHVERNELLRKLRQSGKKNESVGKGVFVKDKKDVHLTC